MPTHQAAERPSGVHDPRQIERHRVWNEKPTLRLLYTDYHRRLIAACPDGPLLDIGGGTAHVNPHSPDGTVFCRVMGPIIV
jgi:hypothetical protein